jgi:acetyltransferase
MADGRDQLGLFMEPDSVAVIGASRRTGEDAYNVVEHLLEYGYRGRIYPVNPNATEIVGLQAYPDIGAVPETVDLAVISLPRELVPRIVSQCVDRGIRAVTIVTQGFTDAEDEEGQRLQAEIDRVVAGTPTRILGPNTFGTANASLQFSTSFARVTMKPLPVGLICQTGAFFVGFSDAVLLGKAIDVGNASDIGVAEALEFFEADEDTEVVALHVEGLKSGRRFLEVAERTTGRKPVVALKTGRSSQAARAVQSHTGSLVGRDEVWSAALRGAGVIRAEDVVDLCDAVRAFYTLPHIGRGRVGVVTHTGGLGITGVDAIERVGLELADLSAATLERMQSLSPSWLGVGNPVDIWPGMMISGNPLLDMERAAIESCLDDPQVDAVLCILTAYRHGRGAELLEVVEDLCPRHPDKALLFFLYGPYYQETRDVLEGTGRTLVFPGPERAARAVAHLVAYRRHRDAVRVAHA